MRSRIVSVVIVLIVATGSVALAADEPGPGGRAPEQLSAQAAAVADLQWLPAAHAIAMMAPAGTVTRPALAERKHRASARADAALVARLNAVLASESFIRAQRVVERWLDARDPETGLLTNFNGNDGAVGWAYQNTGADLYPHIAIGTRLLIPDRYPEMLAVLEAERRLAPPLPELPDDVLVPGILGAGLPADRRMFGIAEYGKDGLLPLIDRLGPDPWLPRLREIADLILTASATPTRAGTIPAQTSEVNGDVLQLLARTYWMTGDERYLDAASNLGKAYLDGALPKTTWLPPYEWDFMLGESIGRKRFHMSDHGNEVFSGLVEWNVAETFSGRPDAAAHRAGIRRMLDRVLARGRNDDGLWFRVVDIPTGKVTQPGLTDNWGYLLQPYLAQAMIERRVPDGELDRADRYEEAVRQALRALPGYRSYPWQQGEMDGYADSIESAIYLLSCVPDPDAERWVDEQAGVLFGFQHPDGTVEDNYLDGNFVRTALLYSLSLTHGLLPDPWRPDVIVGAAVDGSCLEIAAGAEHEWEGRLRFDRPRWRENVRLPIDYPRLNEWPVGFVVDDSPGWQVLDYETGALSLLERDASGEGIPLHLDSGATVSLRVCPAP